MMTAGGLKTIYIAGLMSAISFAAFAIGNTVRVHAAPQSIADKAAKDESKAAPVKIFTKAETDAQFENNKLILDPGHNGQFFVETSRRLQDGEAELHEDETDVFYVVKGASTLVYGGKMIDPVSTMVNGNPLPPGQIHGKSITGGQSRRLNAGDTVIIPSGQPHMFTEVQAPFWYLVVKVRNPGKLGGAPKVN
jgi:mannose-6-phosphate isomerase-like protein (cupin superfamily)